MKKILTAIVIGILCISMFSMLAQFVQSVNASATAGEGLSLNGLSDYVSVPAINSDVYTITLWFNPTTNNALIGSNRFLIQTADGSLTIWHNVYVGPRSWPAAIGTGAWHYLAVIIDYTGWQITPYLDGQNLGPQSMTTHTNTPINWMTIGSYGGSRFFNGLMDEVKIYNRTLTAGEISYDYNSGSGVYGRPATGLVGLWHFDGDAKDYSGYGNDGTVYGTAYVAGHVQLPDVAITEVTVSPTKLLTGGNVNVQVKAKNVGAGAYENFTVSAYCNNSLIGTKPVNSLQISSSTTLTFSWSTIGVPLGDYTIKANATIVQGEMNTTNNQVIDGKVWIVNLVGSFNYSPVPAIENLSTTFDATTSTSDGSPIIWYNWTFGDGLKQNVTTPTTTHTYSKHGSYDVTLTVVDTAGFTNTSSMIVQILRHDVAIVNVTPYKNWVYVDLPLKVNVTTLNLGNFTENVNVDLYYNVTSGGKIGTEPYTLLPSQEKTLTMTWNTIGIKPGLSYTLTAIATILPFDSNTTNNVLTTETPVYVNGTALGFDGVDDYVSVPVVSAWNSSRVYTFEFWLNPSNNSVLVGSNRFKIQTGNDSLTVWYDINAPPVTWSVPVTTGTWHYLAVTIDYRNWGITCYLDNNSTLGEKFGSTMTMPKLTWLRIGSDGKEFFKGSIDEFRIYNTNITKLTAETDYNGGYGTYGVPEPTLVAGYHFDEGFGTVTGDYSGNKHSATIYGATWVEGHIKLPNAKLGDLNSDGKVNVLDLISVAIKIGATGPKGWIPEDVNQDGAVNILDMILVCSHMGT